MAKSCRSDKNTGLTPENDLSASLQGTDPENVIKNAFGCFDEDNAGLIHEDRLRELLTTIGDRFTDDEVDEMYREAPIKNGMFDYNEFTKILKHGANEKN